MESWTEVINNPNERKVFEALADPEWDFRTVDGIRKVSGLPDSEIRSILEKYKGKLIRKSDIPGPQGRDIYTLKSDRADTQELLAKLRTFISKSTR
jgi:hypothetical protein